MNIITDIVFSVTWLLLLVWAIRTMSKGWGAAYKQNDYDPSGMWTTQVTKAVHPEMVGVKPGDELAANYNLYTYPKTGVGIQMI